MMDGRSDVLVVEDDPDLLEIVQLMLRLSGYSVRGAANGREALEAIDRRKPAVVLLDMLMPVMDGWQCARELRARHGDAVPIVVVTAAEHARARANEIGRVADVLPKPFEMDDLIRVVERYAAKSGAARPPDSRWRP